MYSRALRMRRFPTHSVPAPLCDAVLFFIFDFSRPNFQPQTSLSLSLFHVTISPYTCAQKCPVGFSLSLSPSLLLLPFAGSIILYSARGQPASAIVITLSEVCPFCYCRPARRNKTGGRVSSRFVSFLSSFFATRNRTTTFHGCLRAGL